MWKKISSMTNSVYTNLNGDTIPFLSTSLFPKKVKKDSEFLSQLKRLPSPLGNCKGYGHLWVWEKNQAGFLPGERLCTSSWRQRICPCFKEEGHSSISSRDIVWVTPKAKGFCPQICKGRNWKPLCQLMEQAPSSCKKTALNTGIKLEPLEVSLQPQIDLWPEIQPGIIIATTADARDIHSLPIHPVWLPDPSHTSMWKHLAPVDAMNFLRSLLDTLAK